MVERQNIYDSTDTGDYGEVPPDVNFISGAVGLGHIKDSERLLSNPQELGKSHPNVYGLIFDAQSMGKKVVESVDARKGTSVILGTAAAIGTLTVGGVAAREYIRRRK